MGRHRTLKQCPTCGTGDVAKFGANKARRDGLQTYCRECIKLFRSKHSRAQANGRWSTETRKQSGRQKKDFEMALVEQYVTRHITQE